MDVTLADEDAYSTFVEVAAIIEVGDNFDFDLWQLVFPPGMIMYCCKLGCSVDF